MASKEEKIERALRLTWDSLQSHLQWTYTPKHRRKSAKFHKDCAREYAEIIKILTDLL